MIRYLAFGAYVIGLSFLQAALELRYIDTTLSLIQLQANLVRKRC